MMELCGFCKFAERVPDCDVVYCNKTRTIISKIAHGCDEWEERIRVSVWSGDGETFLGKGYYLGDVYAYFFHMPDGSIRSLDPEEKPSAELIEEMESAGAQIVSMGNPKIQLDDDTIVYGCQVWWQREDEDDSNGP